MTDAAAFFANKKKKKKGFKFNANKIDASTVTSTIHVDAPLLSTDADAQEQAPYAGSSLLSGSNGNGALNGGGETNHDQWDDEAMAQQSTKSSVVVAVPTSQQSKDLLDMKSLDLKGNEEEQIANKLRIEETKNQLAAAREGMEREAQRIKDEKEKKEQEAAAAASNRFGAAAASVGGSGKWVPSRLRDGGSGMGAPRWGAAGVGSMNSQKLDTEDQNLFPELAAADAIIEKQKQDQVAYQPPKKTPVGGGASWASQMSGAASAPATRPKLNLKPKSQPAGKSGDDSAASTTDTQASTTESSSDMASGTAESAASPAAASPAPAPSAEESSAPAEVASTAAATPAPAPIKPSKKKKKKDISTFGKK